MTRLGVSIIKVASAVTIALACGLCPTLASATQLEAAQPDGGQLSVQGSAPTQQAATKTVYVITQSAESSNFFGSKSKATTKYTYNKNGLVTKRAYANGSKYKDTNTYSYSGTALKKSKHASTLVKTSDKYTVTYTTNKKGQFTKAVQVRNATGSQKMTRTYTAKYKSGKLKKLNCRIVYTPEGASEPLITNDKYSYTYKKGRVASRTMNGNKATYEYDKMGNLNISKNTYDAKKRLKKQTQTTPGTKWTITYKYKAIKVKASVADTVEAQQWAIINSNYNLAFGVEGLYN